MTLPASRETEDRQDPSPEHNRPWTALLGSFGFRVGFLVVLLAGCILLVMAVVFLVLTHRSSIQTIDHEIRTTAEAQLRRVHPVEYWSRFQGSLSFVHGAKARQWAFQVSDEDRTALYRSPYWPFMDYMPPHLEDNGRPEHQADDPDSSTRPLPRRPPREDRLDDFLFSGFPPGPRGAPGDSLPDTRNPPRFKRPVFKTVHFAGQRWRIGSFGHDSYSLDFARRLDDVDAEMRSLAGMLGGLLLIGLLVLNGTGLWIANKTLKPVRRLTETARGITATDLERRIDAEGASTEFAELIAVINHMLARLERGYQQATRFSADAAHELKTPLTVLQGELDQAVQEAPPGSEEQQRWVGMLEEVQQLSTILRKLLLLSRADSGNLPLSRETVNLSQLVLDFLEDAQAMEENLEIESQVPAGIEADADPILLQQVLSNLFSNALKYKGDPGKIRCTLSAEANQVVLELENNGPLIADEFRDLVFDRFARGDQAHSRMVGGQGLGLSLCREILLAHGGSIILLPGANRFRVTLPSPSA